MLCHRGSRRARQDEGADIAHGKLVADTAIALKLDHGDALQLAGVGFAVAQREVIVCIGENQRLHIPHRQVVVDSLRIDKRERAAWGCEVSTVAGAVVKHYHIRAGNQGNGQQEKGWHWQFHRRLGYRKAKKLRTIFHVTKLANAGQPEPRTAALPQTEFAVKWWLWR